jgi:hypothetical protein
MLRSGLVDWIAGWAMRQRDKVLGDYVQHLLKLVSEAAPPEFARSLYDSLHLSVSMRP